MKRWHIAWATCVLLMASSASADNWNTPSDPLQPGRKATYTFQSGDGTGNSSVIGNKCQAITVSFSAATGGQAAVEECDRAMTNCTNVTSFVADSTSDVFAVSRDYLRVVRLAAPTAGTSTVYVGCSETASIGGGGDGGGSGAVDRVDGSAPIVVAPNTGNVVVSSTPFGGQGQAGHVPDPGAPSGSTRFLAETGSFLDPLAGVSNDHQLLTNRHVPADAHNQYQMWYACGSNPLDATPANRPACQDLDAGDETRNICDWQGTRYQATDCTSNATVWEVVGGGGGGGAVNSITVTEPLTQNQSTGDVTLGISLFSGPTNPGYVPDPITSNTFRYLRDDGTWDIPASLPPAIGRVITCDPVIEPCDATNEGEIASCAGGQGYASCVSNVWVEYPPVSQAVYADECVISVQDIETTDEPWCGRIGPTDYEFVNLACFGSGATVAAGVVIELQECDKGGNFCTLVPGFTVTVSGNNTEFLVEPTAQTLAALGTHRIVATSVTTAPSWLTCTAGYIRQ